MRRAASVTDNSIWSSMTSRINSPGWLGARVLFRRGNSLIDVSNSMILLQVDPGRRTVFPFERQAPWSVHVNRIALRLGMQGVEVKSWLAKLIQRRRGMQRVEANADATLQATPNLR